LLRPPASLIEALRAGEALLAGDSEESDTKCRPE